jgi:hypothetical protein
MRPLVSAYMMSCEKRAAVLECTCDSFRRTDWGEAPVVDVAIDWQPIEQPRLGRMAKDVYGLLRRAVAGPPQFVLFLEDDIRFNRHLRHNVERWLESLCAAPDRHFFATLFNPSGASIGTRVSETTFVVDVKCAFASQALLFSTVTTHHMLHNWNKHMGPHDIRMYQLAALLGPIYCHSPSLVQHRNVPSTWGGPAVRAPDFLAEWRAPNQNDGEPRAPVSGGEQQ